MLSTGKHHSLLDMKQHTHTHTHHREKMQEVGKAHAHLKAYSLMTATEPDPQEVTFTLPHLPNPPHPLTTQDVVTIRKIYNVYPTQYVLVAGFHRLVVLNAANGQQEVCIACQTHTHTLHANTQFELKLPSAPQAPLIVADLNNDGVNDVLVITTQGMFGYLGRSRKGATVVTATITGVMVLLALLFSTHANQVCDPPPPTDTSHNASHNTGNEDPPCCTQHGLSKNSNS